MKKVKLLTIILTIVLISIVGFVGVYVQAPNRIENKVKDYTWSSNLKGKRVVLLKAKQNDAENKKEYTEKDYEISKKTIENRLKYYKASDYTVALDKKIGTIKVELEDDENTDYYIYKITQSADFEISKEDGTVLIDSSAIKSVKANYDYIDNGYQAYLEIKLNDDAKSKLEEITRNFAILASEVDEIESAKKAEKKEENSDGTTNEGKENTSTENSNTYKEIVKVSINGTKYNVHEVNKNKIKILVGNSTTSESALQSSLETATDLKGLLESGLYNVKYEATNQYVSSQIQKENLEIFAIVISVIILIALIVLIVRYKVNGLLSDISYIGQIAVLLLLIRYTNVALSIEGLLAYLIVQAVNYILIFKMLENMKQKMSIKEATVDAYKKIFSEIIPIYVIAVVACFTNWTSFTSFGLVVFWGILVIAIFNILFTKLMLKINASK